jgi:hypothetical protein
MKKLSSIVAGVVLLFLSLGVQAQEKKGADYFTGTWSVLVKGLPDGDRKLIFVLQKKDSTLTGVVQDTVGKEMAKIEKVDLAENTATVYFTVSGHFVNLGMNKKDEDHITGSLMGMFEAEGDRVKKQP